MKKILILSVIALSIGLAGCGGSNERRDATTVGQAGWIFEGWACAPRADRALLGESPAQYCQNVKQKDYLYMKFSAAASQRAIDSGRTAMMMSTCRDAALTQIKGDGLSKIIGDFLEQASGVSDGQSTGVAIVRQSKGLIRGVGIYDCCAMNNDNGECIEKGKETAGVWAQCMCVGYLKYPGGQKGFESAAEQAQAE